MGARTILWAAALAVLAALSGCAVPAEVSEALEAARSRQAEIAAPLAKATLSGAHRAASVLRVETDRPYVGLAPLAARDRLPEALRGEAGVTIPLGQYGVEEFTHLISVTAGVPATVVGRAAKEEAPVTPPAHLADAGQWSGPLDRLLDALAGQYGYEWRYRDGRITIVRRKSALIRFAASPLRRSYEGEVSGGSSAEGGDEGALGGGVIGGSSQSLRSQGEGYAWEEMVESLKAAAADEATVVEASPRAGTIVVSGLPRDVERVKAMARAVNQSYLRPVDLAIRFVRVNRRSGVERRFDPKFSLADAARGVGLTFTGGSGGAVLGVLKTTGDASDSLNATIRALNTLGVVSRNVGFGVSGSNRRASAFNDLDMQTYVESTSSNVTGDTSTSDLNVRAISAGVQLAFTPTVIGRDTVALDLDLTIQDRPRFEDFETAGVRVQRVSGYKSRSLSAPLILQAGDVAVLNGFADSRSDGSQEGIGSAENWLLGGSSVGASDEASHVILVSVALPPAPLLRITDLGEDLP